MTLIERLKTHYYVSRTTDTDDLISETIARLTALEAALTLLTDGFKYSTDVITIARNALGSSVETGAKP